jgi:hypothetical protein
MCELNIDLHELDEAMLWNCNTPSEETHPRSVPRFGLSG